MPKKGDTVTDAQGKKSVWSEDKHGWVPADDTKGTGFAPETPSKEATEEGKSILGGTKKTTFSEPKPTAPPSDAGLAEQAKYQKAVREWERRKAAAELTAGKQAGALQ